MDAGWIMPQWLWCPHSAFLHIFPFSVTDTSDPRAVHKSPWQHGQRAGLVLQSDHQQVLVGLAQTTTKLDSTVCSMCLYDVFLLFPPIPEHDHCKMWCIWELCDICGGLLNWMSWSVSLQSQSCSLCNCMGLNSVGAQILVIIKFTDLELLGEHQNVARFRREKDPPIPHGLPVVTKFGLNSEVTVNLASKKRCQPAHSREFYHLHLQISANKK